MKRFIIPTLLLAIASCTPNAPQTFTEADAPLAIYPDYTDLAIPSNIAPLNFRIDNEGSDFITVYKAADKEFAVKGRTASVSVKKWRQLLEGADKLEISVYAESGGKWLRYGPTTLDIAGPIDQYITYRLIPPSAVTYERLTLNQRDLTNFDEKLIYSNALVQSEDNGQCINCHHCKNWKTDNMQFHARQYLGGTIMLFDGELRKINLKTDSTLSAGVYPAWHPTHDHVAYSVNKTGQMVQLSDHNRMEVQDEYSDLILYDIRNNSVSIIENGPDDFECFPTWSADGRMLYYVSAHFEVNDSVDRLKYIELGHKNFHYDLYAKPFDPGTKTWGESIKIYDASSCGQSITLPRVSPDGRWLMFTMGQYGIFHIWHRDADLFLMDLNDMSVRAMDEVNSNNVESYHSWSSTGEWIIFSSRREDGAFTRPYIARFDGSGHFSKPFALPQESPEFSQQFMLSYNIPEFITEPVKTTPRQLAKFIRETDAQSVTFESR